MSEHNGRGPDGRFLNGWGGGPGRPRKTTHRDYLDATAGSVTVEDWQAIVQKALGDAKAGDRYARDWLSRLLLGDDPAAVAELTEELAAVKAALEEIQHAHV